MNISHSEARAWAVLVVSLLAFLAVLLCAGSFFRAQSKTLLDGSPELVDFEVIPNPPTFDAADLSPSRLELYRLQLDAYAERVDAYSAHNDDVLANAAIHVSRYEVVFSKVAIGLLQSVLAFFLAAGGVKVTAQAWDNRNRMMEGHPPETLRFW